MAHACSVEAKAELFLEASLHDADVALARGVEAVEGQAAFDFYSKVYSLAAHASNPPRRA